MNIINKNIDKIIIFVFLGIVYLFPSHLYEIIYGLIFALVIHIMVQYSGEYTFLNWVSFPKERYDEYKIKENINKIYENQKQEEIVKELTNNAIRKIKSTNENERQRGIEELRQLKTKDTHIYNELMKILKSGLNSSHEKQVIEILCVIYNNINKNNSSV